MCVCETLTTFSFFTASSHTCIPLDSSTSTNPRYCREKKAEILASKIKQILIHKFLLHFTISYFSSILHLTFMPIKHAELNGKQNKQQTVIKAVKASLVLEYYYKCYEIYRQVANKQPSWFYSCMLLLITRTGEREGSTEVIYSLTSSFVVSPVFCSVVYGKPTGTQFKLL